jgi:hypothetical protein
VGGGYADGFRGDVFKHRKPPVLGFGSEKGAVPIISQKSSRCNPSAEETLGAVWRAVNGLNPPFLVILPSNRKKCEKI